MKQRFSSLDVKVITHELSNSLVSLRLANIYDLSSRIFLLKFAKPDHREQLLIDSGFRCHLTSFARATAAAPSPFIARLRKFLRTRRCTKVQQVGTDRVIEIQFSDGAYRLFLEFYAGGNIVLTDGDLTILGLLRNVSEGAEHEQYRSGLKYDLSLRQNFAGVPELTKERVREGLQRAVDRQAAEAQKPGKKIKKKTGDALRKALAVTTTEFPPILLDHALQVTGYDREAQPEQVIASDDMLDKLLDSLREAQNVIHEITSADTAKGYILAKPSGRPASKPAADVGTIEGEQNNPEEANSGLLYEDFHPFKPAQLSSDPTITFLEYSGFNKTVDEFFSSIEGQRLESKLQEREDHAKRKIDQARQEQAKRIGGLQQVQELNIRKAQAIEANVERVEEAVAAVNGLIAQGMDWVDIGRLIENEQGRHNAVAETIKLPLKLQENTVTLLLSEFDDPDDEEDMADETDSEASDSEDESAATVAKPKAQEKRLTVDIDLALTPWANAKEYHQQKKSAAVKQVKTVEASQKALKSTEQKVLQDLKKGLKQEKDVLRPVRKQMWFEKFTYFISSDGLLILAGRDAQQNEILYRRYLKKGDVYVHADLNGAASVIIKNNPQTPEATIPPSTLSQAGSLAVCTSSAWESKAGMSAWWVDAVQVSKTAPSGEYLAAGGFMIRGKKNYLPPSQLLLGFAVMFRISEESKARHLKHRVGGGDAAGKSEGAAGLDGDESKVLEEMHDDDDDDDEFPDAQTKGAADAEDDDDEFPDAAAAENDTDAHDTADAQSDDEAVGTDAENGDDGPRSNPLQANGAAHTDEHDSDSEDEADAEAGEHETVSMQSTATQEPGTPATESYSTLQTDRPQAPKVLPQPKVQKQTRGKRAKAKRAAAKYADQDDEDRELAMRLLGSKAGDEKREAEDTAKANSESVEEARARRRAQHEKTQREGLLAEEARQRALEAGGGDDLEEEEMAEITDLDALVGAPLPGDEILEAIPVCAPWIALSKYKYKAKLQPGQQKKGKAVRQILDIWVKAGSNPKALDAKAEDKEKIWPREAELIKGWREAEIMGVIPVKSVRVMISGGTGGAAKPVKGQRGAKSGRGGKGSKKK